MADHDKGRDKGRGAGATIIPPTAAQAQAATSTNGPNIKDETKSQRFRRLANRRLARAVKDIRALIPLANRGQYESGPEEQTILVTALSAAVTDVKSAFERADRSTSAPINYFR